MRCFVKISIICVLIFFMVLAGCCINIGSLCRAEFERTDQLSAPMSPGLSLFAETSFGSITVKGDDVAECRVVADVSVQAPTKAEAEQIAEKVKVLLLTEGNNLSLKVEKPKLKRNRSVGVSFDITVPRNVNIQCETSYGSIEVDSINGDVSAETSFASIDFQNVKGRLWLGTSYGKIECLNITTADLYARSSFGDIDIQCSDSTPPDIKVDIRTSYGDIFLQSPPSFAGHANLQTSFGYVKTDLPIMVKRELNQEKITGFIGEGTGKLDLRTSFGSIRIK
jgi:hypothetical protein